MAGVAALFDTLTFLFFVFRGTRGARPGQPGWPGQASATYTHWREGQAEQAWHALPVQARRIQAGPAGPGPARPAQAGPDSPAGPSRSAKPPGGKGRLWGKVTNEKLPYSFRYFCTI